MARKSANSRKKNSDDPRGLRAFLGSVAGGLRSRSFRVLTGGMMLCAVAVGGYLGFGRLEQKAHAQERFDRELVLEWADLPEWLKLHDNRHILDGLTRRVDLRSTDRLLDEQLAGRLGRALSDPEVGWVRSVDRVVIYPDGVVSIRCQFREPVAWVCQGKFCYLVDWEGVRLPGRYEVADCEGSSLMIIDGVRMKPPDVGQAWRGADLSAGLKLAMKLRSHSFRHQVNRIMVDNYDGRVDRSRPHIELVTDRAGSRIWWGRAADEEFGTEISAEQKLTLLQTLYDQWGRIDLNRPYVNIMTWPDRIALPAEQAGEKHGRTQRG